MKLLILALILPCLLFAETADAQKEIPLPIGNLALPPSRQPGPLIGFGDNIVDPDEVVVSVMADAYIGKKNYTSDAVPSLIYGVNNDMSLYFALPYAPRNKDHAQHSKGFEDTIAQLEYAYYVKNTLHAIDQATIVANVSLPTGSSSKNPVTGFGSYSTFLGGTYNHTGTDWLYFTSNGVTLTTSRHHKRSGNQFLYQCGFGHNIPSPKGYIFAWMVEFDGQYTEKNKVNGRRQPNTGGNTIYVTPSFWASSNKTIFQLGMGFPVAQHLNGHQPKKHYSLVVSIGITF